MDADTSSDDEYIPNRSPEEPIFNAKDVSKHGLTCAVSFDTLHAAWLAQANHIFSCLQITSSFEDYVFVNHVEFQITIGNTRDNTPLGYLFLCPGADFQTGSTAFRWPECPAYWSLNPSGLDRFSTEEATQLGFPSFQLATQVHGFSWDTSVYAGLRQFHQAQGFDPQSQDIARHLGHPLYELSRQVDSPFAHDMNKSGAEDRERQVEACAQLRDASRDGRSVPAVHTQPSEPTPHSTDLEANSEPQIPNDRGTSGNFIHQFSWGLQQGLETEIKNVDTGAISPFLI
ncbi:hypothetical protein B0H16DRAFT_1703122 [Mycena metata]|uniref:Uncharacterized protein n=1 Tax=Mycena metata TaxID=1033252 RepID=A0AAD7H509_9AGAR|nr:hypothetical protein B0H16DRAFT_1703122 [Mycena metata]